MSAYLLSMKPFIHFSLLRLNDLFLALHREGRKPKCTEIDTLRYSGLFIFNFIIWDDGEKLLVISNQPNGDY